MHRKVIGQIRKLDLTPWQGLEIRFELTEGSYSVGINYPTQHKSVLTDVEGKFAVDLWCNESGNIPSKYRCIINDDIFDFTLPIGDTDIDITALRDKVRSPSTNPLPVPSNPSPSQQKREVFTPQFGQTNFVLSSVPINPHLSFFWVNGNKASYPNNYLIDGVIVKWKSYQLDPNDFVEILYQI